MSNDSEDMEIVVPMGKFKGLGTKDTTPTLGYQIVLKAKEKFKSKDKKILIQVTN